MLLRIFKKILLFFVSSCALQAVEAPSHLQVGLGVFNVNRKSHKTASKNLFNRAPRSAY